MIEGVLELVAEYFGAPTSSIVIAPVSGGDIHSSYRLDCDGRTVFVKANSSSNARVLRTEFESLVQFKQLKVKAYPRPLHYVDAGNTAVLLMDYHELAPLRESSAAGLGRLLATQHAISSDLFGWPSDNYIGLTPQDNALCDSWAEFYLGQRLQPQLRLAIERNLSRATIYQVSQTIDSAAAILSGVATKPSLLHGDLWLGNAGVDTRDGQPMLFDPAPYYGDPEADLAMTELFGRFPSCFYTAYHQVRPIRPGYEQRRKLYNLYHALNHFNLFGASYEPMILGFCGE